MQQLNYFPTVPIVIPMVCITGGANGGKSTMVALLQEELISYGFQPYFLNEVATHLFSAGISPAEVPNTQELIIKKMLFDEETLKSAAAHYTGKLRPVVICDRGIKDCEVYCRPGEFETIIKQIGLSDQEVKDRYSLIIHLRSTAKGLSDVFYSTFKDNPVRIRQTIDEVAAGDTAIEQAWLGAREIHIIGNYPDFEEKKQRFLETFLHGLGMPIPQPIQYKFLVDSEFNPAVIKSGYSASITQYYLESSNKRLSMNYPQGAHRVTEHIRMTKTNEHRTYSYTLKAYFDENSFPYVLHDILTQDEFVQLVSSSKGRPLRKERTYFIWENQYFQYDKFEHPIDADNHGLLEIKPSVGVPKVTIPDFIPYGDDVSLDDYYRNDSIASRLQGTAL